MQCIKLVLDLGIEVIFEPKITSSWFTPCAAALLRTHVRIPFWQPPDVCSGIASGVCQTLKIRIGQLAVAWVTSCYIKHMRTQFDTGGWVRTRGGIRMGCRHSSSGRHIQNLPASVFAPKSLCPIRWQCWYCSLILLSLSYTECKSTHCPIRQQ